MLEINHWFGESFPEPESCFDEGPFSIWLSGEEGLISYDIDGAIGRFGFSLSELEDFIAKHRQEIERRKL